MSQSHSGHLDPRENPSIYRDALAMAAGVATKLWEIEAAKLGLVESENLLVHNALA